MVGMTPTLRFDSPTKRLQGGEFLLQMEDGSTRPLRFEKLSETESWQTYTQDKALMADFLTGDALQAYFLEERDKHAQILETMDDGSS